MEKYILGPYVRIGYDNMKLYVGFGSIQQIIEDEEMQNYILKTAEFWCSPRTEDEIKAFLHEKHGVEYDKTDEIITFFKEGNYIISSDYDKNDRYSRHSLYYSLSGGKPKEVQEKLSQKHVLIIGCGGIGTQVSCALATAGVGEITLIDYDRIEISNLTRQILFTESDEGKFKTQVLKQELEKRNSEIIINAIHQKIEDFNTELPKCDLAIISADSLGLVDKFNTYAVENNIPYLNVGYVQDIAVWGPFVIPGKTSCMACQKLVSTAPYKENQEYWKSIRTINSRSQAPSIGGINMLAASFAVLDALKFLGEYGYISSLNRRVGLWTHNLKIEFQTCIRNTNCPVCGSKSEV